MIPILKFAKLAKNRQKSTEDYVRFQRFQADHIINGPHLIKESIEGKSVLDVGSGSKEQIGYTLELAKYAKAVYAFDINITTCHQENIFPVRGNALYLPFRDNMFDFCFCSIFIEHVKNKRSTLMNIYRVLKPGGKCYLSFPPFYSPVGGHQFKPFHYLPEKICIWLSKKLNKVDAESYSTSFGNWGLYPTTIRQIRRLIKETGFTIESITTRFSPINFAKIPLLNEILTWHVEFILRKRFNSPESDPRLYDEYLH